MQRDVSPGHAKSIVNGRVDPPENGISAQYDANAWHVRSGRGKAIAGTPVSDQEYCAQMLAMQLAKERATNGDERVELLNVLAIACEVCSDNQELRKYRFQESAIKALQCAAAYYLEEYRQEEEMRADPQC